VLVFTAIVFSVSGLSGCGNSSGTIVLEEEVPKDPSLDESFYSDDVYSDKLNDK
jgi:hypothetical protein